MNADARLALFPFWTVLAVGLAAAAIAFLFFASFEEPFALRGDNKLVHFPMKLEVWRQWSSGQVPFWSNGLWSGFPLLGDATAGAWYLPHALAFLVTPGPHLRAFDAAAAMHVGLLSAGTLALLRRLGCGAVACVFGASLVPLASHVLGWTAYLPGFSSLAWWPWVLAGADRLVPARSRPRDVVLASLPIGAQVLAGYPEMGLYSGCIAAAWVLCARGDASLAQRGLRTAALAAASALLAGPQLVPSAFAMIDSTRATAIEMRGLLTVQGSLFDLVDPAAGSHRLALLSPFLGGASLLLAAVAVSQRRSRSGVLAAVAVVAALAALGERTPVYGLVSRLPLVELLRGPYKFFLITQLLTLWLAALGFDALLRRKSRGTGTAIVASLLAAAALTEHALSFASHLPRMTSGHRKVELPISEAMEILESVAPLLTRPTSPGGPPPRVYTANWIASMGSLPMVAGIETTRGAGVALLSPRHQWMRRRDLRPAQLDALGVAYVFRPGACAKQRHADPIALRGEGFCVRLNPEHRPRYELQERVRRANSIEEMTSEMSRRNPPETIAVLAPDHAPLPGEDGPAGSVTVAAYRPGRVELQVHAAGDRMLLVRESWSAGWEARVDGDPVPIHPAAAIFFALPVPAGSHRVVLRFEAPGYRSGIALGALWVALAVWSMRRKNRLEAGERLG